MFQFGVRILRTFILSKLTSAWSALHPMPTYPHVQTASCLTFGQPHSRSRSQARLLSAKLLFCFCTTGIYSALQQNIHKCLYKFQITASNFFTIRKYAFKSFPCSLKFLRRIFCIFCYSAEYKFGNGCMIFCRGEFRSPVST